MPKRRRHVRLVRGILGIKPWWEPVEAFKGFFGCIYKNLENLGIRTILFRQRLGWF